MGATKHPETTFMTLFSLLLILPPVLSLITMPMPGIQLDHTMRFSLHILHFIALTFQFYECLIPIIAPHFFCALYFFFLFLGTSPPPILYILWYLSDHKEEEKTHSGVVDF